MNELRGCDDSLFTNIANQKIFKKKTINSYSIILHTIINGDIYYLISQVRNTISFREFIKGTISQHDMPRYIDCISKEEKYRILTEPYKMLIDDMVINKNSKTYKMLIHQEEDFNERVKKYATLLSNMNTGLDEPSYIFPKGRKQVTESDRQCALRELEEEVHIESRYVTIYNDIGPLEEIYTGLDCKLYKTIYFVGFIDIKDFKAIYPNIRKRFVVTNHRVYLSEEMSKMKMLKYEDAILKLDEAKKYILRKVDIFLNFYLEREIPKRRHSI